METTALLGFDRFQVDCARRRLSCDGAPVALNGKAFDLLLIFIASNGETLSRDALYDRLWPKSTVEDANLSQTIYLLRRALDPSGDGRTFIETMPRYGYRFLKEVRAGAISSPRARGATGWRLPALAIGALAAVVLLGICSMHAGVAPLSAAARDAYALGEYHLSLRTPRDLSYAGTYFGEVRREAPRSALGYAGAASVDALLAEFQTDDSAAQRRLVEGAEAYRDAAFARDSRSSDALAISGFIAYRFQNDRGTAERDLERAIGEDPQNAAARHWHGVVLLIAGKIPEAVGEFEAAYRLQPTSEVFSRWLARAYTYERRPDAAIALATQTVQIERDDAPAWLAIACAQEQRGHLRQALQTLRSLQSLDPYERPYVIPDEARLEVLLQHHAQRSLSSEIDRLAAAGRVDPFETALFYLTVGRKASALRLLEEKRPPFLVSVENHDPRLLSLM